MIKKLSASKEVKENALVSEGKSCRPDSESICVSWPLSVKHAAKITFAQWKCRTFQSVIYPAEEKNFIGISNILAWGKSRVGLVHPHLLLATTHTLSVSLQNPPLFLQTIHTYWCCQLNDGVPFHTAKMGDRKQLFPVPSQPPFSFSVSHAKNVGIWWNQSIVTIWNR